MIALALDVTRGRVTGKSAIGPFDADATRVATTVFFVGTTAEDGGDGER